MHDLEKRVRQAKNNVETMNSLMTKWSETPLYERKDGKKELLLNLEVWKSGLFFHFNSMYYFLRDHLSVNISSYCMLPIFKNRLFI